jgi:hypothetical protein
MAAQTAHSLLLNFSQLSSSSLLLLLLLLLQ